MTRLRAALAIATASTTIILTALAVATYWVWTETRYGLIAVAASLILADALRD